MGLFEDLFGNKEPPRSSAHYFLPRRLGKWTFKPHGNSLLSEDEMVGLYPPGGFTENAAYRSLYYEVQPESLVRSGGLVGDGKNWFRPEMLDYILEAMKGERFRLMLKKSGSSPAVILLDNAEIAIAPFVK